MHRNCVYNRFSALQFFVKSLLFIIVVRAESCSLYMYINIVIVSWSAHQPMHTLKLFI